MPRKIHAVDDHVWCPSIMIKFRWLHLQRFANCEKAKRKVCSHKYTPYEGDIPCTGMKRCTMCGARFHTSTNTMLDRWIIFP